MQAGHQPTWTFQPIKPSDVVLPQRAHSVFHKTHEGKVYDKSIRDLKIDPDIDIKRKKRKSKAEKVGEQRAKKPQKPKEPGKERKKSGGAWRASTRHNSNPPDPSPRERVWLQHQNGHLTIDEHFRGATRKRRCVKPLNPTKARETKRPAPRDPSPERPLEISDDEDEETDSVDEVEDEVRTSAGLRMRSSSPLFEPPQSLGTMLAIPNTVADRRSTALPGVLQPSNISKMPHLSELEKLKYKVKLEYAWKKIDAHYSATEPFEKHRYLLQQLTSELQQGLKKWQQLHKCDDTSETETSTSRSSSSKRTRDRTSSEVTRNEHHKKRTRSGQSGIYGLANFTIGTPPSEEQVTPVPAPIRTASTPGPSGTNANRTVIDLTLDDDNDSAATTSSPRLRSPKTRRQDQVQQEDEDEKKPIVIVDSEAEELELRQIELEQRKIRIQQARKARGAKRQTAQVEPKTESAE